MAAKPVARLTDVHVCPLHTVNAIVTGAETILINNLPMARVGDTTACGATIITGVATVFGENILTAHLGSETSHGGIIATGSHDTFVDDGTGSGAGGSGGAGGATSETTSLLNVIKEYLGSVLSGEKLEESLAQFDKYLDKDMDLETTRQMIDEFAVFGGVGKIGKVGKGAKKLPSTTAESVKDKLQRYLLDLNHPAGGSKAKWFKEALGFTQDNLDDLAKQIKFNPSKAIETSATKYGTKYNQVIKITGANSKQIDVTFGWIRNNDGVVRLVTSIPTPR